MRSLLFVLAAFTLASCTAPELQRQAGMRDPLAMARQLVVVRTATWDTLGGRLEVYDRTQGSEGWRAVRGPYAITVGSAGLGWGTGLHGAAIAKGPVKREGDRRSPAGAFTLGAVYGYAAADAAGEFSMRYIPLDSNMVCVDDPTSQYYNLIVDRSNVIRRDWSSAERMRLSGPWYRWGIIVDHNTNPRISGDGSCIFLHVWGYPSEPTTGCTTFDEEQLLGLLRWLKPSEQPMLVQLPEEEYQRLRAGWRLP
ncbi:MAG: hypothetical protein AABY75_00595 [Bacteroidota bacterium]